MLTPVVVLLLDGLGDRAHPELGGRTANEAAPTPHLDAFVASSTCGLLWPLGPGRAPSSELAQWTFLAGSLEGFPGRAVLEARGRGRTVETGAVLGYAALRGGRTGPDGAVSLDARARGERDERDGRCLLAAIPEGPFQGLRFVLDPVAPGEAVVRPDGPASEAVSDTDSFEPDLHPLLACQPLRPEPLAGRSAAAVNEWTLEAVEVLRDHPVNRARRDEGRPALEFVTTKWWGRAHPVPSLRQRTGLRGAIVSGSAYQGGLAASLGMAWRRPAPRPPGEESLAEGLRLVATLLDEGFDFVYCHDKSPDEAGHTKDPAVKVATIASLDRAVGPLVGLDGAVVVVTGDHATPASGRMLHSGDPVPFALRGPGVRPDPVVSFGECHQAAGWLGTVRGEDVLPLALNAADRARFLGGRVGGGALGAIGATPGLPLLVPGRRPADTTGGRPGVGA